MCDAGRVTFLSPQIKQMKDWMSGLVPALAEGTEKRGFAL